MNNPMVLVGAALISVALLCGGAGAQGTTDKIEGTAKEVQGSVKETVGKATGDTKLEWSGTADKNRRRDSEHGRRSQERRRRHQWQSSQPLHLGRQLRCENLLRSAPQLRRRASRPAAARCKNLRSALPSRIGRRFKEIP